MRCLKFVPSLSPTSLTVGSHLPPRHICDACMDKLIEECPIKFAFSEFFVIVVENGILVAHSVLRAVLYFALLRTS
jgi:hypothetical protein